MSIKLNVTDFLKISDRKDFITKYLIVFWSFCFLNILLNAFFNIKLTIFFTNDQFADLLKVADTLKIVDCWYGLNPYDTIGINYLPPFSIFLYSLFTFTFKYLSFNLSPNQFYLLLIFIFFFFFAFIFTKIFNIRKYNLLFLFSYPFLFSLERGNFALIVFLLLLFSIYFKKNNKISIFLLSLAVSIKLTPIIFFLILIHDNSIHQIVRKLFLLCFYLLVINLISIYSLSFFLDQYSYSVLNFFSEQIIYENLMIRNLGGLSYGNSIYMPIYVITKILKNPFLDSFFSLSPYFISIILFILFIIFLVIRFKNNIIILLNNYNFKLELFCLSFILFTPVSADYYLLILFIPITLLNFDYINLYRKILYLILFLPKIFLIKGVTLGTIINPIIISLLIYYLFKQYSMTDFNTKV
jgi:hypothetical protein